METYTLNSGIEIPAIGYGTYRATDSSTGIEAMTQAINLGYRLIDTAAAYGNEQAVGEAIKRSAIDRKEIFLTTKVANTDRGYDSTLRAFDQSVSRLATDYIDLYLIHWPASQATQPQWRRINASTWRAMERLLAEGRCRAIGVSNFMPVHLQALANESDLTPAVNQIEFHPGMMQRDTLDYCHRAGIRVEAWSPLGRTRVLDDPILSDIAARHGKTTAQICLRWAVQLGVIPIPKSVNPQRMKQNLDIFDFSLSPEEMDRINSMPPTGMSGLNPDNIELLRPSNDKKD